MHNVPSESTWKCCKCTAIKPEAETDCLTRAKGYRGGDPSLATCTHERCQKCLVITPTAVPETIPATISQLGLVSKPSFVQSLLTRSNTVKVAPVLLRSNTLKTASSVGALVTKAEASAPEPTPARTKVWGWGKKVMGALPATETMKPVVKTSVPVAETAVTRGTAVEIPEIFKNKASDGKEELPIPEAAPVARTGWLRKARSGATITASKEEPPIPEADAVASELPAAKTGGWWGFTKSKTELRPVAKQEPMTKSPPNSEGGKTLSAFEQVQLSRNYAYTPYEPQKLDLPEGLHHAWECCACKTGKLHRVRPSEEICQLFLGRTGTRCSHRRCEDCVKRVLHGVFDD
ncbi:hypothetical protein EG327_007347 [Venturia inaequalis]|uniref:Uncharacterized protein n=1 Tax=Venturia inaequalis TaxID=5025 RepID=A0A8H3YYJ1_VENIN|nr:hypothetical protein EG327_007347 [Venturia inaequalis]